VKHSVLQRRFFQMLTLFLVLILLLTSGLYLLIVRQVMTDTMMRSMEAQLSRITSLLAMYSRDEIQSYMLDWIFRSDTEGFLDGELYLFDRKGSLIYPQTPNSDIMPSESYVNLALQGQTIARTEFTSFYSSGTAMLGQRIDPGTSDHGVAFLIRTVSDTGLAIRGFFLALIAAVLLSLLVFLYPMIRALRSITRPIGEMERVADAMTRGDFSGKAKEEAPGELGDLARSLNRLNTRLYSAISDVALERNRLQEVLYNLSEGILAVDSEGAITMINPAMLNLCGKEELPEDRGQLIEDKTFWKGVDSCLSENIALTCTMRLRDKTMQATLTPLVSETRENQGAVCVLQDITEAVALEQTRRDYVANVSHELKTPVTNMRMISETLLDGMITDPQEIRRSYGTLLRESMRLSRLINDLLELSRLQSGTLYLERHRTDPNALLEQIETQYQPMADEVGLQFSLEYPKGPCPDVYTNADRASQIIVQLISNAIQYTQEGTITLSADYDADKVYVHVKDTGVGIAPEDLPHVFERFYKVDRSHSSGGTGLGLSIAREIVNQMKETLTVTSRLGEGSEFTLSLERYAKEQENA